MKYSVAPDVRPQLRTLLIATVISIALWFVPFADFAMYPFRLFVTFIHEGGHILAALLTNSAIFSLTVAPDTSGAVLAATSNNVATLIISSAGYLGATLFGVLLLLLIRRATSARIVLAGTAVFIAVLTMIFGLGLSTWNIAHEDITVYSILFTVASGSLLAAALLGIARYANQRTAQFFLSFLAVQCTLNALFDLKTVFYASTFSNTHNDAVNMANATGVPAFVWVAMWIAIAVVMVSIGLRFYGVSRNRSTQQDLPFED